ncbi:MAG: PIN domain-containing protein [Candidatus Altiarchaeota archaeon]
MKEKPSRLVLDANVFFSALVKDSFTRKLILELPLYFYTPDVLIAEITANLDIISQKNKLTSAENRQILHKLMEYVTLVEYGQYESWLKKAHRIMKDVDPADTPYLALAMSFQNDGIWSDDKHFQKQETVKVWKTKDIIELI